jgi:hypothetical protein
MYPTLKPGDQVIAKCVPPDTLQVGDIVLAPSETDHHIVHRLVKILPQGKGILKGDSLLKTDLRPVPLSTVSGKVDVIVRGKRFVLVSRGLRSQIKGLYAWLSLKNLTLGALRLKVKLTLTQRFPLNGSNHINKERRFIIKVLSSDSPPPPTGFNWSKLTEIARQDGVLGLLYQRLKTTDIPPSTLSQLKDFYQSVAAQNLIALDTLEKLEGALVTEGIEVITLKGASLLDNPYPGVGMRPMGDLDLMVRPQDQERFVDFLHTQGYQTDPSITHLFRKNRALIDLHIHALNTDRISSRASLFPAGMEPVWANSVPWQQGFRWLRRPDDVDNILLLSLHLMKHSFSSLIWLVDIYELLRGREEAFWTELSKRAKQLSQTKAFSYTLFLLDRLFHLKPPQGAGFNDLSKGLSRFERGALKGLAGGQALHRLGPLFSLLCVHGTKQRIAFLWETVFPKQKIIEEEFIQTYKGKRHLFYPGRLLEVVVLTFRQFLQILGALVRG